MEKKKYETNKEYLIRKTFYSLFNPKTTKEKEKYEMYSLLFINILLLKCAYPLKQQNEIKKIVQNKKKELKDIFDSLHEKY
jgi:hypothetical protein